MKIKDVIKTTALLLGKEDLYSALNEDNGLQNANKQVLADADLLTRLANLVITELCTTYIFMKKCQPINFNGGKAIYTDFEETPIKILGVYDEFGNSYSFTVKCDGVLATTSFATIEYAYKPNNYDLDSVIGYTEKDLSIRTLALGLSAEYCIVAGRFDEAVLWHKRYEEDIERLCMPKNAKIRQRSFS